MVGDDDEWARCRQVLPSLDPQVAQDGKGQPDAPAHEKADDPPPRIRKLRRLVLRLGTHEPSMIPDRSAGKKFRPGLRSCIQGANRQKPEAIFGPWLMVDR